MPRQKSTKCLSLALNFRWNTHFWHQSVILKMITLLSFNSRAMNWSQIIKQCGDKCTHTDTFTHTLNILCKMGFVLIFRNKFLNEQMTWFWRCVLFGSPFLSLICRNQRSRINCYCLFKMHHSFSLSQIRTPLNSFTV